MTIKEIYEKLDAVGTLTFSTDGLDGSIDLLKKERMFGILWMSAAS